MALPAFQPEDEEDVAGAAPGVAPVALAPSLPPSGMPQMPGMPPGAPPTPGAPPPADQIPPDPNANLPPDALMQPGPGLQPPAPPLGAPGGPHVPLTPDGKIDIPAAEKGALAEQGQLTAQGEDAERRKGAAEAKVAEAESAGADKQADLARQTADEQQKIVATANQRTQQWLDQAQQDAQKYRGMGLHDYWADKSTGDKVLAGLSMLFGAAGKTQGGPENNPGMGMIERAVERDFRKQQADIEKARSNVAMDKEQFDLGMTAKQQALADSQLKKANAYDAAAAQLVSYKLKQGVPLAQAQTDANVVALRQKGLAARQELLQAVHAQNVADAHLQIEQERADAYRAKMARGHGAGGGGGGSAAGTAYLKWRETHPDATPGEQAQMADSLKIQHVAKGGHESLKTLEDQYAGQAKAAAADEKLQARVFRDPNTGEPRGLVPSTRNATDYQKKAVAYDQALRSLREIEEGKIIPRGAKWDNAVLAVASATTLNPTESTKKHEEGTLKGFFGTIDKDAVRAKIRDIETRQEQLEQGLEPLPDSFVARAPKPRSPAPSSTPAPAAGKIMPDGSRLVTQINKKTGATRQALQRPDGTIVPVP